MPDISHLAHLPAQADLVASAHAAFADEPDVRAIVLPGSLSAGTGDRLSDADVVAFTRGGFHRRAAPAYARFETGREIVYRLDGGGEDTTFRKYLFGDMTSAEIHCIDLSVPFRLSRPFRVLLDQDDLVPGRITDARPPAHAEFPVYTSGDDRLIWELFDCIKWLSRGDAALAKGYLKRLVDKL